MAEEKGFYQKNGSKWDKLDLDIFDPKVFTDKSTSTGYQNFRTDISTPIKYLDINYTESKKHFNFGQIKIWKDGTTEEPPSFNFDDTDRKDGGNISIDIKGSRSGTKSDYYNSDNKPIYYDIQEEIPSWTNYNYEIDYELPTVLDVASYGFDPNYNVIYDQYRITFDNNSTYSGYTTKFVNFNDTAFASHPTFAQLTRNTNGKVSGKFKNNYEDQNQVSLKAERIPPTSDRYSDGFIPNSHYHYTYTNISDGEFKPNFNLRSTQSVIQNGETVLKNYTNVNYLASGNNSKIKLQIYWKLGNKFNGDNGDGIDLIIPVKTTEQKIIRDSGDEDTITIPYQHGLRIATLKSISTTPYEYNPETGKWDKEITDNDTVSNARINVEMNFSVESIAGYTLEVDVLASTQRS